VLVQSVQVASFACRRRVVPMLLLRPERQGRYIVQRMGASAGRIEAMQQAGGGGGGAGRRLVDARDLVPHTGDFTCKPQ